MMRQWMKATVALWHKSVRSHDICLRSTLGVRSESQLDLTLVLHRPQHHFYTRLVCE